MIQILICLFAVCALVAEDSKIAIQNSILAKVGDQVISVIDVKKKMDLAFYKNFSHLADSEAARCQFYEGSFRHVLMEMIDQRLILADAADKNIPLTDGEVREEMEQRFGPNIMFTLDKIGLTYDETFAIIKDELMVQRMTWWFIHAKAIAKVTPEEIRGAFRHHLQEHPAFDEWKYKVVAVRGEDAQSLANTIYEALQGGASLEKIQEEFPCAQISHEFVAADSDLSDAHRKALHVLSPGQYSAPIVQKSKVGENVARIFFLNAKTFHPAPQFEMVSSNLRNELVQKAVQQESSAYLGRLRKHYSFYENVPNDFHPFSLQ